MTITPLARFERFVLAIVAATILLLALIVPPFQVPDEPQHFSRAVQLAGGAVFAERRDGRVGATLPRRFADLSERDFPREQPETPTRYRPSDVADAAIDRVGGGQPVFVEFANVANYAPTLYFPQAAGVLLGKLLGAPALACFYLGRLANALAAIALLAAAVAVMPFGRPVLLAVAALPTMSYQAGSVSPDATINGFAFLVLALALRSGFGNVPGTTRRLALAAVPLGLCKGVYAPIALAGLRRGRMAGPILALVVASAAFILWTVLAGGDQAVYQIVSRKTDALVWTVPLHVQLDIVLGDPLRYLGVLVSSVAERSPVYALQIVGRFGWNAILLPLAAYPLAAVMLAAGVLASGGAAFHWTSRLWWLMLALGIAGLIETVLYLTGTPLAADYIQGSQGRYFLPVLPLIGLAAIPPRFIASRKRFGRYLVIVAAMLQSIAIGSVLGGFWLHGFTAHKGLAPIAPDAAGVSRALVLPSPYW